jgi:superfamily II DNA or RNA helicase
MEVTNQVTDTIRVEKINEVYMKIISDASTLQEITDFFAFRPAGYQFSPKFKARIWDGYVRLITPFKPLLYVGLLEHLKKFCETREYNLIIDEELQEESNVPDDYGYELSKEVGSKLDLYDYQNDYIVNAIRKKRSLSLSPTSSGKSFMQYLIAQHYYRAFKHRVLVIVPTISLVHQMAGDFVEYGCDPKLIYKIQGGVDKNTNASFVISTWQSLQKLDKDWFDQFRVVMGDEAHLFTGKALSSIMEKCTDAPYRFGFTGTISSDSKTHQLILQGLFGEVKRFVSTKDLIDSGKVATFKVKALVLTHPKEIKTAFKKQLKTLESSRRYAAEREFLVNNNKRNLFIRNLVWSLEGQNNLILFELVEKHGKILEPLLRKEGRHLHFIYGNTPGEERERIRHLVENDPVKNHDILASYGVFSTGVSLKRLDNLILASGSKSEIRILQSIGRTLRKGNGSDDATLYDIADDLSSGSYSNYTLDHFKKRIEIYSSEQFPFKIFNVNLT